MIHLPEHRPHRDELITAMKACEQAPGLSVWQHCKDVYNWYQAVVNFALGDPAPPRARFPAWLRSDCAINSLEGVNQEIVSTYLLFHDCGKPFCREVDDLGRQHFPGHAAKSAKIWRELRIKEITAGLQVELQQANGDYREFASRIFERDTFDADMQVCRLMEMDMDAHQLTPEQVEEFSYRPEAMMLLFAAVAEVHANAQMFGGFESTGFKIKIKHLERRGRQVLDAKVTRETQYAKDEAIVRELGYIPDYMLDPNRVIDSSK